jgi:ABC-type dipeptide/oligopeptide/nickel transport system permease component
MAIRENRKQQTIGRETADFTFMIPSFLLARIVLAVAATRPGPAPISGICRAGAKVSRNSQAESAEDIRGRGPAIKRQLLFK